MAFDFAYIGYKNYFTSTNSALSAVGLTSGGSYSGGSGASGAISSQAPQQPLQQRFVNISLSGSDNSMYSKEGVRGLIERINDEVKDGAVLRVI